MTHAEHWRLKCFPSCVSLCEFVRVNAENQGVKGIGCPRAELQAVVSCHMWILETELGSLQEVRTLNHEPSLRSHKIDFSKKQCLVLVGCSLFFFNYGQLSYFLLPVLLVSYYYPLTFWDDSLSFTSIYLCVYNMYIYNICTHTIHLCIHILCMCVFEFMRSFLSKALGKVSEILIYYISVIS